MPSTDGTRDWLEDAPSVSRARFLAKVRAAARDGVIKMLAGSGTVSAAFAAVRLGQTILIALGMMVVAAGLMYLGRAVVHKMDPAYARHQHTIGLVRSDRRFACIWIGVGLALVVLPLIVPSHLGVALIGVATTLTMYISGIARGGDIVEAETELGLPGGSAAIAISPPVRRWTGRARRAPRLPGTRWFGSLWGRKTPTGQLSAYLTVTLLTLVLSTAGYASLATAEIASRVVEKVSPREAPTTGSSQPSGSSSSRDAPRSRSAPQRLPYATLCPALPDPLAIGHELGELFIHDGAIQAGCGEPAARVGDSSVWMARGVCADRLRSVAVSAPGFGAVLLYGTPAEFAWDAGNAGRLLYVQTARPGGGDLSIVATLGGTDVFVRPSPSLRPARHLATRCTEIDDVARAFVHMPPPLAALWLQLLRRSGWAWPVSDMKTGQVAFVDHETGKVVGLGGCTENTLCYLSSRESTTTLSGSSILSLQELKTLMPPGPR